MSVIRERRPSAPAPEDLADDVVLRDVLPKKGLPRVRGEPVVAAILPNGRVAWLHLRPAPASGHQLDALRRAVERQGVQRAAEIHANAAALRRLAKRVAKDGERLVRRRLARGRKLVDRMAKGDEQLAKTLVTQAAKQRAEAQARQAGELALLRRQRRRQLWDGVVVASALPLFAAYGQERRPFGEHNVSLALLLGVWLFGDELSDLLSGTHGSAEGRGIDVWSYIAPLGNLFSGWWLLSGRQHRRFVTGVVGEFAVSTRRVVDVRIDARVEGAEVAPAPAEAVVPAAVAVEAQPLMVLAAHELERVELRRPDFDELLRPPRAVQYVFEAQLDLGPRLAPEHVDDFRGLSNAPVVASLVSSEWVASIEKLGLHLVAITAMVELGVLTVSVIAQGPLLSSFDLLTQPTVAWIVDALSSNESSR